MLLKQMHRAHIKTKVTSFMLIKLSLYLTKYYAMGMYLMLN